MGWTTASKWLLETIYAKSAYTARSAHAAAALLCRLCWKCWKRRFSHSVFLASLYIRKDQTAAELSPKCQCRLNHLNPFLASKKHCSRTVRATEIAWHHGHPGWNQEQGARYEWCFWRWKGKASIIVPVRNGEDQRCCTMWALIQLKILRNRSHQKPFAPKKFLVVDLVLGGRPKCTANSLRPKHFPRGQARPQCNTVAWTNHM